MAKTYKDIYNELIGKKFCATIISYKPHKGTYEYLGYSHRAEANALNDIAELIIPNLIAPSHKNICLRTRSSKIIFIINRFC